MERRNRRCAGRDISNRPNLAEALDTLRSEKLEEGPKLIALDSA